MRDPLGRPGRPLRPHARAVPRRSPSPSGSGSASRWCSRRSTGWRRPGGSSHGEFRPGGAGTEWCDAEVLRTLRRRSLAALRQEVEPVPPTRSPGSCRSGSTSAATCAGPTACCASSSSCRARPSRPRRWRAWCSRPASPATRRRCSTSCARPARCCGRGTGRCPAPTAGSRCTWPTPRRSRCPRFPATPPRPRCTSRSSTALDGGGAFFFRQLSDAVGSTDDADAGRGALGPGLGRPAHQRHARPGAHADRRGWHATAPSRPAPRGRYGRSPTGDAHPHRSADRGRALVAAAGARDRHDSAGPRARRDAARPARRGDPRRRDVRAGAGRVRRRLPRAGRVRGDRALSPRLLRRGARRGAVRAARRGRPDAGDGHCGRARRPSAARALGRCCWPPPTRPTRSAPRCRGPAAARTAATSPAARPARWSCSSTATWCSTSSAAGARCSPGPTSPHLLQPAVDALALAVREGHLGKITVERADGAGVLDSPLGAALESAGFHATSRGLRLRS